MERQPFRRSRVIGWLVAGLFIWIAWQLFGFHVTESQGTLSAAKAKSITGLTLPPAATNIRAASHRQWIEYGIYLRFEASADVCRDYARIVAPNQPLQPVDSFELASYVRPTRADAFTNFAWFDLSTAKNVVAAGGGPSTPRVWIDQDRGVFYYQITD